MRIFKKLRKFGTRKQNRRRNRKAEKQSRLHFESMEGRVLLAGSLSGGAVADVGSAAIAQQQSSNNLGTTTVAPVGVLQTAENILTPENVAHVVTEQVKATAISWVKDGTLVKLLAEGKTPDQLVSAFLKDTAKGSLNELARQGAKDLTGLNLEQVDAVLEAAKNGVGIVEGDPLAYVYAGKMTLELGREGWNQISDLNEIEHYDPTKPFRDPLADLTDFEHRVEEALQDADTERNIADHLAMEGLGGTPDPFKFENTNPALGGNPGTGPAPLGETGGGSQSPATSGESHTPSTPTVLPSDHVQPATAVEKPDDGGMSEPLGGDDPGEVDGGSPEPGGEEPGGEEPAPGDGGGAEPPGGSSGGDEGGGDSETPDPLGWYEQNEDGSWSPAHDPLGDDDPSDGNPNWWNQDYDDDEILPEEEDDTQGGSDSGGSGENDDDNTNEEDDNDDDSTEEQDTDDDDDDDAEEEDTDGDDATEEDEGCEAPPGEMDEPHPDITTEEAVNGLEQLREELFGTANPFGIGGGDNELPMAGVDEGCEAPPGEMDDLPPDMTTGEALAGLAGLREQLFGSAGPLGGGGAQLGSSTTPSVNTGKLG